MAERSNAAVLKTVDCHRSGGSNPSLSANPNNSAPTGAFFILVNARQTLFAKARAQPNTVAHRATLSWGGRSAGGRREGSPMATPAALFAKALGKIKKVAHRATLLLGFSIARRRREGSPLAIPANFFA